MEQVLLPFTPLFAVQETLGPMGALFFMEDVAARAVPAKGDHLALSYVLPIAAHVPQTRALSGYLRRLSRTVDDVIVVDGSPEEIFDAHARSWSSHVRHLRPGMQTTNGKVAGVMTGVQAARHECLIVADDDVRYRHAELVRMRALLQEHEVVRPQNYFHPLPWHARWDAARSLLNRLGDGDWPGTLGVRRSFLLNAGGYSGEVLFENLELVRTIHAAGGREAVPFDLFVVRRPPDTAHFLSQRVRQAYDEWARPRRFAAELALLPAAILVSRRGPGWLLAAAVCTMAAAEAGRRRGNGRSVFPASSALWAPAWLAERAVTSWMALGTRLIFGGVRYRNTRMRNAATPRHILEENVGERPFHTRAELAAESNTQEQSNG
ncbi:glycosyltransferase [Pelagerythrobacter rhizovicinus]|nr:glycosyltransferase family 2 protein [Pelagerythrobacter rhizovicinus]